jgi:PBP1b-binding outer membrane lipoprotein LpoB
MKYFFLLLFGAFFLFSCGPSKEEMQRQKRIEDSLLEIERNNALLNANKLLDSTFTDSSMVNNSEKK